jgi:hypothetical protein
MRPATFLSYFKDTKAMLIRTFLTLAIFSSACFSPDNKLEINKGKATFETKLDKMPAAEVDTLYAHICKTLESSREKLSDEYSKAGNDDAKEIVLVKARKLLLTTLADSMFVCWYGTGWDFNGTTTCPRQGNIACGYFVTTLLKQSGFLINRTHLAQVASSEMIKTFCPPDKIKTITNNQTKKLFDYIKTKPDGIFIVGLDNHTGFIVRQNGVIDFVHANYLSNVDHVMKEPLEKSEIILSNGFFMVGELLYSDATLTKWVKGEKISE